MVISRDTAKGLSRVAAIHPPLDVKVRGVGFCMSNSLLRLTLTVWIEHIGNGDQFMVK